MIESERVADRICDAVDPARTLDDRGAAALAALSVDPRAAILIATALLNGLITGLEDTGCAAPGAMVADLRRKLRTAGGQVPA